MTDRSRRVPPSRSAATKARELEADANQKEAQLQDLRNKVSQEKQEIDKLISKRGPQLWSSSKEIRASTTVRHAAPVRSGPAKAKGGLPTEPATSLRPAKTPEAVSGSGSIPVKAKPAQASPLHSHTSLSSLQRANSTSHKSAAQTSTPQSKARPAISSSLQRTGSSNTASSAVQSPKLQPTASLKSANSLQRSSSGNNSPRNPYLQGAPQKATALQRKGSSNGPLRKGPATVSSTAATDSMRSPASTPPHVSTDGASSNCSVSVSQSRNQITEHRSMTGQTDAAVAEILDMPIVRHQVKGAAFVGPSLLEGQFNEDDSSASFADALKAWRGNGRCAAVAESPATGMSSQAGPGGLAQSIAPAHPQTYFERLFWNQASRQVANAVVDLASRSQDSALSFAVPSKQDEP